MAKKPVEKTELSIEMGNRIKEARKKRNIGSVGKLAKLLNYTRQTVSGWENGVPIANLEVLRKLCEILDCDIGYLFGEYDSYHIKQAGIGERTGLEEFSIETLQRDKKKVDNSELGPVDYKIELKFINDFIIACGRIYPKMETLLRFEQYLYRLDRAPYVTYYLRAYSERMKTITSDRQLTWYGPSYTDPAYLDIIKDMMEKDGIVLDEKAEKKMIANANRFWYCQQYNKEELNFEITYSLIKFIERFIDRHLDYELNTFKDRK